MSETETKKKNDSTLDADLSGRLLGDYQLLRRLGRGGMADVYLAEQRSLKRKVAIKVLKPDLAADDTYVRRFHHEAQAAASLVHANIVQIYEVGCADGIHFIAQEYVEGRNLKQYILSNGTVDARLAVSVMRQVASALLKAAAQGIVHRDIKPENIMLARSGEVKVADFGLARVMGNGEAMNLTQVGITMGTPLYMSPEQVEGKQLDPRSDIYSLGITCYHMLAGVPPFRGETALAIAMQHVKNEPDRLETCRDDLPIGLCRIVHKMLAKLPGDRYGHAAELLRDLRDLRLESADVPWPDDLDDWASLDDVQAAARHQATLQLQGLMNRRNPPRPRWPRALWAVILVSAAGIGGAAAVSLRKPDLLSDRQDILAKQPTIEQQMLLAVESNSEAAWLAVITHYSGREHYKNIATRELARIYIRQSRYDDARRALDTLAGSTDELFQTYAQAGLAIVFSLQGEFAQSKAKLDAVPPDKRDAAFRDDLEMREWLDDAESKIKAWTGSRNPESD